MKIRFKFVWTILAIIPTIAFADNVNVSGNIITTGGSVISNTGNVQASTYFYTPGFIQAGASGTFGTTVAAGAGITGATVQGNSWVYSPGYLQAPTGVFTNVLRTGGSTTTGSLSSAFGAAANAASYSSLVVGKNNTTTALDGSASTPGSWVDKDPLFVVGNGNGMAGDPNQFRNAFTVYKDGTVTMSKAQGDISMGQFGN